MRTSHNGVEAERDGTRSAPSASSAKHLTCEVTSPPTITAASGFWTSEPGPERTAREPGDPLIAMIGLATVAVRTILQTPKQVRNQARLCSVPKKRRL